MSQVLQQMVESLDIDFTVTIAGRPALPLVPAAQDAVQALMDGARAQAKAVLNGTGMPAPSAKLVDRMRKAIAGWDALAKAEKAATSGAAGDIARERAAREAFEDLFNLAISQFEQEFPHG